ncbi:hypothetical protein PRIPAC_84230 [Pristionchus pacificus]|uniref:Uncharacterized protein n=1 Tax=Pristionchus pacificus TaxID=54126 RepID=A0A454Y2V3_PRIPA|nr:hypothetical protein PRIPAC_84230 [Pristionchus pacificus]|eukprot:PDM68900.1 hypothetical protein PRIPAC_47202 [Pristionchus pacificus]
MEVSKMLEARAQQILCEAILKGMEAPSDVESRAARDDAKKRALRAEHALAATMKRWEDIGKQLDNHRGVIDPAKAEEAKQLDEQKAALRVHAATMRQALEDHGIQRDEFEKRMDESDALDAEIVQLLRAIEGEKEKENVFKRVSALKVTDVACKSKRPEESGVEELDTVYAEMEC